MMRVDEKLGACSSSRRRVREEATGLSLLGARVVGKATFAIGSLPTCIAPGTCSAAAAPGPPGDQALYQHRVRVAHRSGVSPLISGPFCAIFTIQNAPFPRQDPHRHEETNSDSCSRLCASTVRTSSASAPMAGQHGSDTTLVSRQPRSTKLLEPCSAMDAADEFISHGKTHNLDIYLIQR